MIKILWLPTRGCTSRAKRSTDAGALFENICPLISFKISLFKYFSYKFWTVKM